MIYYSEVGNGRYACLDRSDESTLFDVPRWRREQTRKEHDDPDRWTVKELEGLPPCPGRSAGQGPGLVDPATGACTPAWRELCPLVPMANSLEADRGMWRWDVRPVCTNSTFWSGRDCGWGLVRCFGNTPGFCHETYQGPFGFVCPDGSNLINGGINHTSQHLLTGFDKKALLPFF